MRRVWCVLGIAAVAALSVGSDRVAVVDATSQGLPSVRGDGDPASASSLSGTLEPLPPMSARRAAHTASSLPDGRVLVAGGFVAMATSSQAHQSNDAEIFLPNEKRFASLPRMVMSRQSHTATLLTNGTVLLAGGYDESGEVTPSAEIFDPKSDTFAPVGSMLHARAGHVAVQLDDGRVLLVGGVGPNWSFLSSAEIYDPATGRFSVTGGMETARESHVAVRLEDGRVLVTGGHRGRRSDIEIFRSSEIYDPLTKRFRPAASMKIPRHKHDAVLLPDGRILVTGGADERDSQGVYDSTELFDPDAEIFTLGPAMQLGHYKHAGTSWVLPNGNVLVSGGAASAELFDVVHGTFRVVDGAAHLSGQFSASALLEAGAVLVSGGYGGGTGPRDEAWLYRPPVTQTSPVRTKTSTEVTGPPQSFRTASR